MTNTIPNVPRQLLERAVQIPSKASVEENHAAIVDRGRAQAEIRALLSAPSPAGVDGLKPEAMIRRKSPLGTEYACEAISYNLPNGTELCRLSDAQAIIDGLRGEVVRLREERDSFQRIGIRQIEHRYQLAALLLEKFPRIDPHHPITLSEVDHCCEYVLHKDRERLHCAIDAAMSAGKEGE